MRQRDPTLPLHVITPLEVSQQQTGLRIILRATPQLEQFPRRRLPSSVLRKRGSDLFVIRSRSCWTWTLDLRGSVSRILLE
jgi:hypothetical protein